jgi:hypothetical protein
MRITDLKFVPQGTPGLNIEAFDCGRRSVNDFFYTEKDGPLETRLMFRDMILLKRPSIR